MVTTRHCVDDHTVFVSQGTGYGLAGYLLRVPRGFYQDVTQGWGLMWRLNWGGCFSTPVLVAAPSSSPLGDWELQFLADRPMEPTFGFLSLPAVLCPWVSQHGCLLPYSQPGRERDSSKETAVVLRNLIRKSQHHYFSKALSYSIDQKQPWSQKHPGEEII